MLVIGVTGGSGSGKSTFSRLLAQDDIPILDADVIYHRLTEHASPCTEEIGFAFGNSMLNSDGSVCRPALAALVFGETAEQLMLREKLNSITHKYVEAEIKKGIKEAEQAGKQAVILDVPLLFESGIELLCDKVIAVIASDENRLDRIVLRDGVQRKTAINRITSQPSPDFYLNRADYTVYNDAGDEALQKSAKELHQILIDNQIVKETYKERNYGTKNQGSRIGRKTVIPQKKRF